MALRRFSGILFNKFQRFLSTGGSYKYKIPAAQVLEECRSGTVDIDKLRNTVQEKIDEGIIFEGDECAAILHAFFLSGLGDEALELLKKAEDKGLVTSVRTLTCAVQATSVPWAVAMKNPMRHPALTDAKPLAILLDDCLRREAAAEALDYYKIGLVPPEKESYDVLLHILSEHGTHEEVKEMVGIVEKMIRTEIKIDQRTYAMLRSGFERVGQKFEGVDMARLLRRAKLETGRRRG